MKAIPAMHRLLADARIEPYVLLLGREQVKRAAEEYSAARARPGAAERRNR